MKTIVAGSRTITSTIQVYKILNNSDIEITEVVSGGARGVDKIGEKWANRRGLPVKVFNALWSEFGKRAGMIRNVKMAGYADALIAIWDGESSGTKHMIEQAKKEGLVVEVYELD